LKWNEAVDNESVYGYEIYRSIDNGPPKHLATVKRNTHYDLNVAGGESYRYFVVAYDLAGNRSAPSNVVELCVSAVQV
jgi:fibronectin type 3 domain-containing protein